MRSRREGALASSLRTCGAACAVIFVVAFALRLIAIFQYQAAPDFQDPIGDSAAHVQRAWEILGGDLLGDRVYFDSAPLYPYFIALVFRFTDGSFLALRIVQAALGALGCVIVSLIARRLDAGRTATQLIAGLAGACYATLAFLDIDLLMISLTVLLVVVCLWLLLRAHESGSRIEVLLAGVALGLAASDKLNLLLCVPVAAWFLAGSTARRPGGRRWLRPMLFVAGTVAAILPITARNFVVGHDLVLVSSNGGVNLYIGNNDQARGTFHLPAESGLSNLDLEGSAAAVAEQALGRTLRPSEVSRFWARAAWRFALEHPLREAMLLGLKLRRLVGAYEIPNHLNLGYMAAEFIPVLRWMLVGAGLAFPLGVAGIGWRLARGATPVDRLLCGFAIAYSVSLLPFFITERYRLPLVPVLLVYAAWLLTELARGWRTRPRRIPPLAAIPILACAVVAVHWPAERFPYSFDRVAMATKYFARALRDPYGGTADRDRAIVQLKWALETDPYSADAHYNLGVAYESVEHYSGALVALDQALRIEPGRTAAAVASRNVRAKLARRGDRRSADTLPRTPYEKARAIEQSGDAARAATLYRELVRRDPFHSAARARIGALQGRRG